MKIKQITLLKYQKRDSESLFASLYEQQKWKKDLLVHSY